MNKLVVDKYIILTDNNDISFLLSFLKKHDIRTYNYKVLFIKNKLFIRIVLTNNIILSIENLPLEKAESIIPKEKNFRFKILYRISYCKSF